MKWMSLYGFQVSSICNLLDVSTPDSVSQLDIFCIQGDQQDSSKPREQTSVLNEEERQIGLSSRHLLPQHIVHLWELKK